MTTTLGAEKRLVIRADAGAQIGTGHLLRCLALAQAWKDAGGEVTFVTACQNEGLLSRLQDEAFKLHIIPVSHPDPDDWKHMRMVLEGFAGAWVVLDGYHFDEDYQLNVKETAHRLLVTDGLAQLTHYYADIVLNPNLYAEQLHYLCEPGTSLLLGTRYALLRREFLAWKDLKREIPEMGNRLLVTLGGSDPDNCVLKVIRALDRAGVSGLEVTVVIGASNHYMAESQQVASSISIPIRLVCDVQNMADLMAWADLALVAGGITPWEMCFMGVPMLVMIIAENQKHTAQTLHQAGIVENLGWHKDVSEEEIGVKLRDMIYSQSLRESMSQAGRKLVDGFGPRRVIAKMDEITRM
jgi:UDP-2,4-diacetamido-2,4,6-trideoxy-beta-L-altropyranose hydrolase